MSTGTLSPLVQPQKTQGLEWFIVVETGSLAGQRFPIRGSAGPLTLGRDAGCAIQFDPNQERMVGRRHAQLEVRNDGVYLVDNNSANGTFKDGQPVSEVRLQHGDRFQLGGEVEGVQGPWISIHIPVAVHVAPPRPDAATLVTRPGSLGIAPVPLEPSSVRPASPSAVTPTFPSTPLPAPPTPLAQPSVTALSLDRMAPEPQPPAPELAKGNILGAAVSVDPEHGQRRRQLVRQIVSIVMLLVFACCVGLALGLRQGAGSDDETAGSSE